MSGMPPDLSRLDLRSVEDATVALHAPELDAAGVMSRLERTAVDLHLAEHAVFVPAGLDHEAPWAPDEVTTVTPTHRPSGLLEGWLHCVGTPPGADWALETLATHAGIALATLARIAEGHRRARALHEISERLQDALLPELPQLPSTALAVAYRAAATDARVGGDFYDVFELPDGRVLVVVGDVVGKGIEAASRTSQITHTLRALALTGLELSAMLERCDEQISYQDPEIMATVWCGLYEPTSGELEFASLGHPPALLLRAEGEAIRLTLEGLPLGLRDLSPDPPEIRSRLLGSRDLIVLYTDGVVEASRDYLAGQESLLDVVREHSDEPLSDLIDHVLDTMLGASVQRDDAVVLALRRR